MASIRARRGDVGSTHRIGTPGIGHSRKNWHQSDTECDGKAGENETLNVEAVIGGEFLVVNRRKKAAREDGEVD
jgi:hypothetical protein